MFYIRNMAAVIYDGMILLTLFFLFTALCLCYRHGIIIPSGSVWYQLSLLCIIFGYYFLSYRNGGQTIGMKAWRLRLVSLKTHLSSKQILARFFLIIPAFLYAMIRFKNPWVLLQEWTQTDIIRIWT